MKALTVRRPYAHLLLWTEKQFETRRRRCLYRGPIALHVALNVRGYAPVSRDILIRNGACRGDVPSVLWLPLGVVIGVIQVVECFPITPEFTAKLTDQERNLGFYYPGWWAWRVEVLEKFKEPIPALGKLGLWNWSDERYPASMEVSV